MFFRTAAIKKFADVELRAIKKVEDVYTNKGRCLKMAFEERKVGNLKWNYLPLELQSSTSIELFIENIMPHIKPNWKKENIKPLYCNDGLGSTNDIVGVYEEGADIDKDGNVVLVRTNGKMTHHFIDREMELVALLLLHQIGEYPPIYFQLANGLCYGYVPGRPGQWKDLADAKFLHSIAVSMTRLHSVTLPENYSQKPVIFCLYDQWLSRIPMTFTDKDIDAKFKSTFGSIDALRKESEDMKSLLMTFRSALVLCHNDLQYGNLIYNEATGKVTFIDYEYCGLNYVACELGDFFGEFAGLDMPDYSLYPDEIVQKKFIRVYLEESAKLKGLVYLFVCVFVHLSIHLFNCPFIHSPKYTSICSSSYSYCFVIRLYSE